MRMIHIDQLLEVIKEYGIDPVYATLEKMFIEEPLVIVDREGKVLFIPFEEGEIWDFLEMLLDKVNTNTNEEVEP